MSGWMNPDTAKSLAQPLNVFGTVLNAGSQVAGGYQANKAARFEAAQADVNAGQAQAASQRNAADEARKGAFVASKAQALAAASGAGATDPTVVTNIAEIARETAYRESMAMYGGDERARAFKTQAAALRAQGSAAQRAGWMSGFGTIVKGADSLFGKYGRGGIGYGKTKAEDADPDNLYGMPY